MSGEAIKSVCSPGATTALPPFPPLCASAVDAAGASNELELQLRILVVEHRKVHVIIFSATQVVYTIKNRVPKSVHYSCR